jgi:hypothetical protein
MLDNDLWEHVTSTGTRHGTIEVTPETAKIIVARVSPEPGKQRPVIRKQVERYADQMTRGKWRDMAGGDLLFDCDGYFRGGQHRLLAQIDSGVTVAYKVRWDQDEDEIAADNEGGRPWAAVDIAGGDAPHRKVRQGIATSLLTIDHEQGLIGNQPTWQPARLDVAEGVNDPRVIRAAVLAQGFRNSIPGIQGTSIGIMYAMACNANGSGGEVAPYFFEKLRTGHGLFPGDPIDTLRNMLLGVSFRNLAQKKWQTMYVTARAWNYHVNGEKVAKLQRYTPPTNLPLRMIGWKPFFPQKEEDRALRALGSETMVARTTRAARGR